MSNTESINQKSIDIDLLSSEEYVSTFIETEQEALTAIKQAKTQIAKVIDAIEKKFFAEQHLILNYSQKEQPYQGPRLFYVGAGTSGRLGVLDASECPPTFSSHPQMIQGIIAGGNEAMFRAIEGAEDDYDAGFKLAQEKFTDKDVVLGISANGGAPFVLGALAGAKEKNSLSIAIANNAEAKIFQEADLQIFLDSGPELLSGSTRLKAGTSQKITLNMISTGLMIRLGKVYSNLMVDLQASNKKLKERAKNLVVKICQCNESEALSALENTDYNVKLAVLKISKGLDRNQAIKALEDHQGFLRKSLES